tara:strand:- start:5721 stop:6029 length:309 start_codon:yes stop_codon:yes gene_type:complete
MSQTPTKDEAIVSVLIKYIQPVLLTILGTFIYSMISEMKSDVKQLLVNQSANQIRIETLQQDVSQLKEFVYSEEYSSSKGKRDEKKNDKPPMSAKKEDEITL